MQNDHPTLLRMPRWLGYQEERTLPGEIGDYEVRQIQPDWLAVVRKADGARIYEGIGPVELLRSPAPF
ncbi:hypothetical protein [Diaphorobacter caeni]|uniref:hypothetical protein n=1 Tax=Diaphorobacter caeni TaxID=2784387 RepID=UPI00188ED8BD|nr:hypothetical protein [Diaphorobacter caeni]MBF5006822.1 hypothetical protein [Diaphorobacter caeni]